MATTASLGTPRWSTSSWRSAAQSSTVRPGLGSERRKPGSVSGDQPHVIAAGGGVGERPDQVAVGATVKGYDRRAFGSPYSSYARARPSGSRQSRGWSALAASLIRRLR